jgi:uncharacterized protein
MTGRTNPNRKQSRGLSIWHEAVRSGDIDRVRSVLDAGADINALDEHGQTALMNAVYWGNLDIAKLLIEHGAKLNHTAKWHLTALLLAVIGNRPQMVQLLIDAGADRSIRGSKGQFNFTPLEYARTRGFVEIIQILEQAT